MRHVITQMSPARRQLILDEAYANGRMGVERLPPIVHSEDTSDTLLVQALEMHAAGQADRAKESRP